MLSGDVNKRLNRLTRLEAVNGKAGPWRGAVSANAEEEDGTGAAKARLRAIIEAFIRPALQQVEVGSCVAAYAD